ncbi:hypothetical protein [Clostridium beijerinckii]|uniref:hypothetical protein n=1 Tax=Clostridium beijerinckii TaxID=1520 RepID=UPI001F25DE44|nr:hypothetical protein [Clostridium beijerinckii]
MWCAVYKINLKAREIELIEININDNQIVTKRGELNPDGEDSLFCFKTDVEDKH